MSAAKDAAPASNMSKQIDIPHNALELRDVVDAVLSRLDTGATLARAACVCKLWREAAEVDALWQAAYESAVEDAFSSSTQSQLPGMLEGDQAKHPLYGNVKPGFRPMAAVSPAVML